MISTFIQKVFFWLRDEYEDMRFDLSLPSIPYPATEEDFPELAAEIDLRRQQHALLKEARSLTRKGSQHIRA